MEAFDSIIKDLDCIIKKYEFISKNIKESRVYYIDRKSKERIYLTSLDQYIHLTADGKIDSIIVNID